MGLRVLGTATGARTQRDGGRAKGNPVRRARHDAITAKMSLLEEKMLALLGERSFMRSRQRESTRRTGHWPTAGALIARADSAGLDSMQLGDSVPAGTGWHQPTVTTIDIRQPGDLVF